jgi:hypothetical protein
VRDTCRLDARGVGLGVSKCTSQKERTPGFVSAQWVRLDDTTGTSMLTFESEEAANKAAEMLKANPPGGDAITINSIEIGEVVERV